PKLDVLDGLETLKICTGFELDGHLLTAPPPAVEDLSRCVPRYLEMPGWTESTVGATQVADLPANAQRYLAKIEELSGLPIDIISTGPDRAQTIVKRHPFDA
ncbi:MAG: adenylosuccinate synthetase, partial [Chromatiaceae bacterium]|nr:adenylosuccinate synthetase [Chromatiaceae bacterium]